MLVLLNIIYLDIAGLTNCYSNWKFQNLLISLHCN